VGGDSDDPATPSAPESDETRAARRAATVDLVSRLEAGDTGAASELLPLVYDELRSLAAAYLRRERRGHTLQPTALVHEAWMQVSGGGARRFSGRTHFLATAAIAMRQLLVQHARRRATAKRGGDWQRVGLVTSDGAPSPGVLDVDALDLHAALEELADLSERQARVVELRFFGGLTIPETAEWLGVGETTVEDDWHAARAWLLLRLRDGEPPSA